MQLRRKLFGMCIFDLMHPCLLTEYILESPWKTRWVLENPGIWSLQVLESPRKQCFNVCTNPDKLASLARYYGDWSRSVLCTSRHNLYSILWAMDGQCSTHGCKSKSFRAASLRTLCNGAKVEACKLARARLQYSRRYNKSGKTSLTLYTAYFHSCAYLTELVSIFGIERLQIGVVIWQWVYHG